MVFYRCTTDRHHFPVSIRSERQMVERLSYDMLFRWFVGLSLDDQVWHATTFTHNRDRRAMAQHSLFR